MSQNQAILEHLKEYGWITPLEALRSYGCSNLSAQISNLRKKGEPIRTQPANVGTSVIAKYIYEGDLNF